MSPLSKKDCEDIRALLRGKALGYTYADLERWLTRAGWSPPNKAGGSHRVWTHKSAKFLMVKDDGNRELLPCYPKHVAKAILEAGGCPDDDHE